MSDSEIFAVELAMALGLNSGADGRLLQMETDGWSRIGELHDKIRASGQDDVYLARVAALYLPALVRATIATLQDRDPSSTPVMITNGLTWMVRVLLLAKPYASRFGREHPEETRQLFQSLARCLGQSWALPTGSFATIQNHAQDVLFLLDQSVDQLAECMVANATSSSNPPVLSLDAPTRRGLRETVRRLVAGGQAPSSLLIGLSEGAVDIFESRHQLIETAQKRPWPYWDCQAQVSKSTPPPCVERPSGEEMAICSQCLSVRYCSRAHQKADWKRHKLVCFKPSW